MQIRGGLCELHMYVNMYVMSYHQTKARLANMTSNLWSSLAHASHTAVVLVREQTARCTLARSPPGTTVGGW